MKHHRFVNVSTKCLKFFVCKSIVDYINIWQKLLQQKNLYPKFKHEMTHEHVQMTHFDYQTIVATYNFSGTFKKSIEQT